MLKKAALSLSVLALATAAPAVMAKVSADEAAKLGVKGQLTPTGGNWNANSDGTIPEWVGDTVFTDAQKNMSFKELEGMRENPEELEKTLGASDTPVQFTITADNFKKYADKLTESQKAMFEKYPATYKMNVYESIRNSFAHPTIVEETKKNATRASLSGTDDITGAEIGFPFPIPKKGAEIIWNHKLKYRGTGVVRFNNQAIVAADGSFKITKIQEDVMFGYANLEDKIKDRNLIAYYLSEVKSPPRLAGQLTLVHETANPSDGGRKAWLYNPGQGRVNRAPKVGYDNPSLSTDGEQFNDQVDVFNGALDRYDWKLVGVQEKYISYNSYKMSSPAYKYSDLIRKGHVNPDIPRYELHRVYVVEATLKPGFTHQLAKRTFYVDEDSWTIASVDGYDNQGALWKFQEAHLITLPFVPTTTGTPEAIHDVKTGRFFLTALSNEEKLSDFEARFKEKDFKTSALRRRIK